MNHFKSKTSGEDGVAVVSQGIGVKALTPIPLRERILIV